jgi:anti-sigma B factor antagonist
MECTRTTDRDIVLLELSGRMDTVGVDGVEPRFYASLATEGRGTVVDLSRVTVLTSMGIRLLVSGAKTAKSKGLRVVLVAPAGPVRDVLDNGGITEIIPAFADRTAARAALAGASGGVA